MPIPPSFALSKLHISSPSVKFSNSASKYEIVEECGIIAPSCKEIGHGANGTYWECGKQGVKITTKRNDVTIKDQMEQWLSLIDDLNDLREKIVDAEKDGISIKQFFVLPNDDIHICKKMDGNRKTLQLHYSVDHINGMTLSSFLEEIDTINRKNAKHILRELYIQLLFALIWLHEQRYYDDDMEKKITHNDLRRPNIIITRSPPFTLTGDVIKNILNNISDDPIKEPEFTMKNGYIIKIIDWELLNANHDVSGACNEIIPDNEKYCARKLINRKIKEREQKRIQKYYKKSLYK